MWDFLKRLVLIAVVISVAVVASVLVSMTPDSHAATATLPTSLECYHALKDSTADASMKDKCRSVLKSEASYQPCRVKLPIKKTGCLGELCDARVGCRVSENIDMRDSPSMAAAKSGALPAGTQVKSRELVSMVMSVGKAIQSQILDVDEQKVEKLRYTDVLSYVSDGNFEFCRDKNVSMSPDEEFVVALEPEVEEWAQVKLKSGQSGWVLSKYLTTAEGGACRQPASASN